MVHSRTTKFFINNFFFTPRLKQLLQFVSLNIQMNIKQRNNKSNEETAITPKPIILLYTFDFKFEFSI